MSDSIAGLRHKIASAGELQAVVRTMKALAAANIGQYERAVIALGDYDRSLTLGLGEFFRQTRLPGANGGALPGDPDELAAGGVAAIVFGSDQGLVGQFNEVIADHAISSLSVLPGAPRIWAVGERVHARLAEAGLSMSGLYGVPAAVGSIARLVGQMQIDNEAQHSQGGAGRLFVFHNRPTSGSGYEPTGRQLLPFDAHWQQQLMAVPWPGKSLPEVMGSTVQTLRSLLGEYLFISLFRACAESLASENASRLAAMERADRNILDLLDTLRGDFRRRRQSVIDEELFDVTAGYEALGQVMTILVINGGSSSIRFALFDQQAGLRQQRSGKVERIGLGDATLTVSDPCSTSRRQCSVAAANFGAAFESLLAWLDEHDAMAGIAAAGHRVVHGMGHTQPELISPRLLDELHRLAPFDPDHLPAELQMIELLHQRHPQLPQVACFDTSFHHDMPRVAQLLPIPRQYADRGVRRYGFHGLSYEYLMEELARLTAVPVAAGRVILAHLGNGASLAAVRDGRSIDTSMGFTPTGGIPMGTRSGDLDPGLATYLQKSAGLNAAQFYSMANHDSGLLGLSGTSADMRDLLTREADDDRAAEAVALFCYQVRKCIGAYAAALGGIDTLVFAGGIGENAAAVRARVCAGLEFLGIHIDAAHNAAHAGIISTGTGRTTVRIIRTDEERMIARSVARLLESGNISTGAT